MQKIDLRKLDALRISTFNLNPRKPLSSPRQALTFINARGFAYFWKIKGVDLPSLWVAVAGERPVADKHDDPGHVTWAWKDDALGKKIWYYAKILRGKATMIALEVAPYFYALSENYGAPEEDYLDAYHEGRLSQAAKQTYEALLTHGALNTLDLRKAAKLSNAKDAEFNLALEALQRDFKILPVGVAPVGAWKYAHIYEIVTRHYPNLAEQARPIKTKQARLKLLDLYFKMVGAVPSNAVSRLFGWGGAVTQAALRDLVDMNVVQCVEHPKLAGEWFALKKVL